MTPLRIYVDFATTPEILAMLKEGTAGHVLVQPEKPIASVLVKAEKDPQFASVDVAFGQPDVQGIKESTRLKWVHVSSSGITRYDTTEFRALMAERGIQVSNSAGVYNEACAVHAMSFMLGQARQIPLGLRTRAASGTPEWLAVRANSRTLKGETVLILGYGAIGKRLAELLAPFGVKVLAYRRKARGDEGVPVVTDDGLEAALGAADHVMNILPESASTIGFFDRARFASLKPGAVFYNIGRGTTVNQEALAETLHSGHLAAAWLDVTDPEPLPDGHVLWSAPNCHITPHTAGGHQDETKTLVRHFLENFQRYVKGEALVDRVM